MNINNLSYWISEAAVSIVKNQKIFWSGVAIMTVALFLISFFFVAYEVGNSLVEVVEDSQGKIEVYLQDIDEAKTAEVRAKIENLAGVNKEEMQYISKEEAMERAKEKLPAGITEGVPADIYPASFIVPLHDLSMAQDVANSIREIDGVGDKEEDVQVNENSEFIAKVAITIKVLAITILILTIVSACFIMMNSIKLMLYARRKEISIMKYVGATDTFTKAPFIIEGLVIAVISAGIVILFTSFLCGGLADLAAQKAMFSFLASTGAMMPTLSLALLIIAAGIGTVGSSMSINKYLDV